MPTAARPLWTTATSLVLLIPTIASAQPAPGQLPPMDPAKVLKQLVDDDKYPFTSDPKAAKKFRDERIASVRAATLDVFSKGDRAQAAWATKAMQVLLTNARREVQIELSGAADAALDARLVQMAEDAVKDGCDDPLVRYLIELPRALGPRPDPKLVASFRETVAALDKSTYPDRDKLYAVHNWLSVSTRRLPANDPLRKDAAAMLARFWELFERVAGENTPLGDAAVLDLGALWEAPAAGRTRKQGYEVVAGHLEKGKASKCLRLVAEGRYLSREGWDARGIGFAGTVGPEAAKVFRDRVAAAREKFEAAWEADKTRFQAPTDLIQSCRDLGLDRATMEQWFTRAMAANPDNRVACLKKLDYLHPKWKGSVNEYVAFGAACAASDNVAGGIPLAVVDVHTSNAPVSGPVYAADPARVERYYSQTLIWMTLRIALVRLQEASPENTHLRTLHARIACLAGRWDVAHAEFEKLGGKFEATFFPEPGEYDRFVERAKNLGAPKK